MSRAILSSLVLTTAVLLSLAPGQDKQPRRIALLIGVNEYSKESGLGKLDYAEADVTELAKLLRDSKPAYDVTVLTGADATQEKIAAATRRIRGLKLNRTDVVLVGLAGHGKLIKVKEKDGSYFVPHDGVPVRGRVDSLLSIDSLVDDLQESGAGARFLLIDACRDAGGRGVRGGEEVTFSVKRGTGVLFSCKEGEIAHEPVELKHGLFFYHVIQKLKGSDGELTWGNLVGDITDRVPRSMPKRLVDGGAKQHPDDLTVGAAGVVIYEKKGGAQERKPGEVVEVDIGKGVKLKLCWVPPGTAQLGAPKAERMEVLKLIKADKEPDWLKLEAEDNRPLFRSKGFWLGKYEVKQQEWLAVMGGDNPSHFVPSEEKIKKDDIIDTSEFPVEKVSWDDCQKLLDKLNDGVKLPAALGKGRFVLPHEDEWEYACRGGKGNGRAFYFGDELNGSQANSNGTLPYGTDQKGPYKGRTTRVGSYEADAPHPWGLCDMHGNVWEWCENKYPGEDARVVRGGSWSDYSWICRAARRYRYEAGIRNLRCGVRVCFRLD